MDIERDYAFGMARKTSYFFVLEGIDSNEIVHTSSDNIVVKRINNDRSDIVIMRKRGY